MNNDDNKKTSGKIGGIDSSKKTQEVQKAENVAQVQSVKAASAVGSVQGAGGIDQRRKATRVMSAQEREHLLRMVDDEAEKLFKSGAMPNANKELITRAVKMAVDSSIVLEGDLEVSEEKKLP